MLLTTAQLHEIRDIIKNHHSAFVVNYLAPEAVPQETLDKLQSMGLVNVKISSAEDAYLIGQAVAAMENPKVAAMSYDKLKAHLKKNPVALNEVEQQAIQFATHQSAQYVHGLGNKVDLTTGQLLIEADAALRARMQDEIQTHTAENIAKRQSVQQLKSDLGWATRDWTRDWNRIAVTEKHNSMQRGVADSYRKRHGDDVRVAKRPMPDACKHCKRLHLGPDGHPRIFKLSDLEANGTNYGRVVADWLPTVGSVHPHCQCQLVRIPDGYGFDESGAMVPGGAFGVEYDSEEDIELSLKAEDDLRKAFKLQGHLQFQGLPIAIENKAGSVRKWKDADGNEGQTTLPYAYGYVKGTSGADVDDVDVFIGPNPKAPTVYIVHQQNQHTGQYDEDKCMLGFSSLDDAKQAYMDSYDSAGPKLFQTISQLDIEGFKRWMAETKKPAHGGEMIQKAMPLVIPLQKSGPFIGPRGGKWADAAHTKPWKAGSRDTLTSKVGEAKAEMYADMAEVATSDQWKVWMAKLGIPSSEAASIQLDLKAQAKEKDRERASAQWNASEAAAFQGLDMATGLVPSDLTGSTPGGLDIHPSLEVTGKMLGGLAAKYPEAKKLIQNLKGVRPSKRKGSGHAANYQDGYIEVNDLSQVSPGVLLHELGHSLENELPAGWSKGKGWATNDPSASTYAAGGGHSEQLAEAFVAMVAGNGVSFRKHAPEQAELVSTLLSKSLEKSHGGPPLVELGGSTVTNIAAQFSRAGARNPGPGTVVNYLYNSPDKGVAPKPEGFKESLEAYAEGAPDGINAMKRDIKKDYTIQEVLPLKVRPLVIPLNYHGGMTNEAEDTRKWIQEYEENQQAKGATNFSDVDAKDRDPVKRKAKSKKKKEELEKASVTPIGGMTPGGYKKTGPHTYVKPGEGKKKQTPVQGYEPVKASSLESPAVYQGLMQAGTKVSIIGKHGTKDGVLVGYSWEGRPVVKYGDKQRTVSWPTKAAKENNQTYVSPKGETTYQSVAEHLKGTARLVKPKARQKALVQKTMQLEIAKGKAASEYTDWLHKKGNEVFLVGGIVRDLLAGTTATAKKTDKMVLDDMKDIDIVSTAHPGIAVQMAQKVGGKKIKNKAGWGVVTIKDGVGLDVAMISNEAGDPTEEHRAIGDHDLHDDSERRDFTCNALFYDLHNDVILDPTGKGIEDAENKVLRLAPGPKGVARNASLPMRFWKFRMRGYTADPHTLSIMKMMLPKMTDDDITGGLYKIAAKGGSHPGNREKLWEALKARMVEDGAKDLYKAHISKFRSKFVNGGMK